MTQCHPTILDETAAARQIATAPRPVMIVDTCNFGNIVGLALAGKTELILNALRCLQEGLARQLFYLVVPHQVYIEFHRPGQFVKAAIQDLERQIRCLNAALGAYNDICAMPNLWKGKKEYRKFDIGDTEPLLGELVEISGQFLEKAIVVEASPQAQQWARHRAIDRKRPARQGKDSFGDCEICGTTLSFLEVLRKMKFEEAAFFVSENKEDFTFDKMLHPDLQADFAKVSLEYCQTIPKAYGEIWKQRLKSERGKAVAESAPPP